jgi:glycine betaine catabolism A
MIQEPRTTALEPTLPGSYYLDPRFFDLERKHIFNKEWFCIGREEELPESGDYLHVSVVGESILVVRTREGELRAFYNVCRHRGCQLAMQETVKPDLAVCEATGHFPGVIQCKYHAWTYDLEGRLRAAPYLNDAVNKNELSLYPVAVDTWGGFVFVNLEPEAARAKSYDLETQLGKELEYSKNYPLKDLRIAKRIRYEVQANWKVILENYNECYHCAGVHPELCEVVPAFKENGGSSLDWTDGIPHKDGAFTFTFSGTTEREPFPGLDEHEKVNHKGQLIFPNIMVSLAADHVAAFTLFPKGANETIIFCDFLFHPSEVAKPTFNPNDATEFWDVVNKQDWTVCEGVQRGMGSSRFTRGYYAPMEDMSADIRRYIQAKLGNIANDYD